MSTYVLLGATGDLLSFLPLLHHEAKAGQKPRLMVAKAYADVLEGVSYVEPVVFDGDWLEVEKAMEEAKKVDPKALCVQVTGRKDTHRNGFISSFDKEQWYLAGKLQLWREQAPLVFDKRNPEREASLLTKNMKLRGRKKRVMLIHADGKTSPFPYRQLLFRYLELAFPNWERIDLGKVKAERVYDLLGLYDRADLLVACDSAPLHLARACPNLPVVALTKDSPSLWHGSSWRPQFIAYCRYSDFPARLTGIEERILAGTRLVQPQLKHPAVLFTTSAYGPTLPSLLWVSTSHAQGFCVDHGAAGRDSVTILRDPQRYPFLRDVLLMACLKAKDEDVIALVKPEAVLDAGRASDSILKTPLAYAHRRVKQGGQTYIHPAVDLFCFPKKWWQAHQDEVPDLVMGKDWLWEQVLLSVMKKHGAVELPFGVEATEKEEAA